MTSPCSLDGFLRETSENDLSGERFGVASDRMLCIQVDGGVWLKPSAAVAYRGDLTFARLSTARASSFPDGALRELAPLVRASGRGRPYQQPFQMFFEGSGFVVVQPHKNPGRIATSVAPLRELKALLIP